MFLNMFEGFDSLYVGGIITFQKDSVFVDAPLVCFDSKSIPQTAPQITKY